MNKHVNQNQTVLMQVAGVMLKIGIEGLPRNYEIVYEAMSGANPELTREFLALGLKMTQADLDALGRRFFPHHHEQSVLAGSNTIVRQELQTFMKLLEREKTSLDQYGTIIGEASRSLSAHAAIADPGVSTAVRAISAATELKVAEGQRIAAAVERQASVLDKVVTELDQFERAKYIDPLTGLANRRAFNKELIRVYENPAEPLFCGVVILDMDNLTLINQRHDSAVGDKFIRHVATIMRRHVAQSDLMARMGGGRFGVVLQAVSEDEVFKMTELMRSSVELAPLVNRNTNISFGHVTLSAGICMSPVAGNAADLVAKAEMALAKSKKEGRNRTTVYAAETSHRPGRDWMLYRA